MEMDLTFHDYIVYNKAARKKAERTKEQLNKKKNGRR